MLTCSRSNVEPFRHKDGRASFFLLIVGAGIYGATASYKAKQKGKRCLVIDIRPHLGGNIYCENVEGINVHKYGAHIFHTNNKKVWEFVNGIVEFNRYTNLRHTMLQRQEVG